eukprot:TRINITY_DN125_c5_g1_i3.p1 TRINITY_DN125_c5_g1~~TRINITY_DN125_c5_g1_i3.p1  ORF type:complete len:635 (+),score=134.77 TRINITY_DN125_c5_g1_i3:98-1906(+)
MSAGAGAQAATLLRDAAAKQSTSPPLAQPMPTLLTVLAFTVPMALCAGLGALPFFFVSRHEGKWAGHSSALACGVMLSASFDLLNGATAAHAEGAQSLAVAGLFLGALTLHVARKRLVAMPVFGLQLPDSRRAVLVIVSMTLHAVGEGLAAGVSFAHEADGWQRGRLVSTALALHNIPEGLCVALVLAPRGAPPLIAAVAATLTRLPQPLAAAAALGFARQSMALEPLAMGFAVGCMLYTVVGELLPDAFAELSPDTVAQSVCLSVAVFEGIRLAFDWAQSQPEDAERVFAALGWSTIAGMSTGVGGVIVALRRDVSERARSFLFAQAAGVMLMLSFAEMLIPNLSHGLATVLLCFFAGALIERTLDWLIQQCELEKMAAESAQHAAKSQFTQISAAVAIGSFGSGVLPTTDIPTGPPSPPSDSKEHHNRKDLRIAVLIAAALAVHNAPEGLAVGLTASAQQESTRSRTPAVVAGMAIHNVAEGVAVAATVLQATGSRGTALTIATLTGLVEPLAALLSVCFLHRVVTAVVLDFVFMSVAGIMVTVSVRELLPQACARSPGAAVAGLLSGVMIIFTVVYVLEEGVSIGEMLRAPLQRLRLQQ